MLLAGCGSSSTDSSPTTTAAPAASSSAAAVTRGDMCGQTRGPDGPLYVHALGAAKVDCVEAMTIADKFSPQIATGKPATVDGWNCSFPTSPGMLARCDSTKGPQAIGFFSSH
ncbi:hypothetical protein GCM10009551_084390 [Nocardiopsis tropica]|uniref:hypothetical protein n=1 Tax=Tsukamurella strandjordii TaxID=147577 RepID=UPI0031D1E3A8